MCLILQHIYVSSTFLTTIATALLDNINRELFITEKDRVVCEVGGIFMHNTDCFRSSRG